MNRSIISSLAFVSIVALAISTGCGGLNPCGYGQVPCGDGCMVSGNTCCGNYNCPAGDSCGAYNTCIPPVVVSGCASYGEETCTNTDGVNDCAPIGSSCCHNHTYCPVGRVCVVGGCQ